MGKLSQTGRVWASFVLLIRSTVHLTVDGENQQPTGATNLHERAMPFTSFYIL